MHVDFKHITIHNFMSFGHVELSFNDDGFIRVTGVNENPSDNAGSNGSGKSSLWEALVWAITGDTIRGTKQIVNIYGEDGCFVDLDFCIDNKQYKLIRSKDHKVYKTNLQIFIDGQDVSGKGIRDSTNLLQQYIPDLTASLIGSVIVLGQGLPQKFTNNSPSGRKEVLEKLSKSDFMIEDLKDRVATRKTELSKDLRTYENNLISLNSKKLFIQNQLEQQSAVLSSLNEAELSEKKRSMSIELSELQKIIEQLDTSIENLFSSKEKLLNERTLIVAEENKQLYELNRMFQTQTEQLNLQKSQLTAQLSVSRNQLSSMRNIRDICPTCGQKLPDVHKPDTSEIESMISAYQDDLTKVQNELSIFEKGYEDKQAEIKKSFLDQKSYLDKNYSEVCSSYDTERELRTTHDKRLNSLQKEFSIVEVQLAQLQATIDNCNKIIRDNNEELKVIEDNILYNNMQKDLTQSHLDVISKFDTALKRDFRGYLLSTVIEYIEARAKQYCKVIFDTTDIGFCLNGNNIDISYMNKAYENLSGGEKQKIDLIIQFSIRDMLLSQLNFTCNLLVLDEVFDGLDTIGCNRVIDMISNLSDVKNVFIVTHRKDLSIPCDKEVIVVKSSEGISEIR